MLSGKMKKRIMKAEHMTFNSTEKSTFGVKKKYIVVKSLKISFNV